MQENPFKKLGRAVGIASVSALSMFPGDKTPKDNINENKTEWNRQELDTDEETQNLAAYLVEEEQQKIELKKSNIENKNKDESINPDIEIGNMALESEKDYYKETIPFLDEAIKDYSIELLKRDLLMPPEKFAGYTKEGLLKEIEEFKKSRVEMKLKLDSVNQKIHDFYIDDITEFKAKNLKRAVIAYDEGRKWVLDNINNPEYRKRLKGEFEKSLEKYGFAESSDAFTDKMIEKRLEGASDENYLLSKNIGKSYETYTDKSGDNVGAFYSPSDNITHFPLKVDPVTAKSYAIHEYAHKVTKANELLTPQTIELLSESFDSTSVAVNLTDIRKENLLENLAYFSNPTEMYARKKQFDSDLEKFGIKKYEEKFTLMHFTKALKLKLEGKLSNGGSQFINSVKPRNMIKVMNEIAEVPTRKDLANEENLT